MKTETAHTPGPWIIKSKKTAPKSIRYWVESKKGHLVVYGEEGKANATLTSAAPDLLEAAKYFLRSCTDTSMSCDDEFEAEKQLRQAIAKAEGRTEVKNQD